MKLTGLGDRVVARRKSINKSPIISLPLYYNPVKHIIIFSIYDKGFETQSS